MSMTKYAQVQRLRLIAAVCGARICTSIYSGNRERAYHFLRRMNKILKQVSALEA